MFVNKTQPLPKYSCYSCKNRKDNYCHCFKRPIDGDTRCYYHSRISIHKEYRSPINIKEIAYENYLREIS